MARRDLSNPLATSKLDVPKKDVPGNGKETKRSKKRSSRLLKRAGDIFKRSKKVAGKGKKAVDEGRDNKATRLLKKAARLETRSINIEDREKRRVSYTTKDGSKIKSRETIGGRLKETIKNKKTGYKSKQISKDGVVKRTVTKTPTGKHKEVERGKRRKVVTVTKDPITGKRTRVVKRSKI